MQSSAPLLPFIQGFQPAWVFAGLKVLYMAAFGLYVAFALVVLVQIRQMVTTIQSDFDATLKMVGWLHLAVAVGAFLLAFMVL